MDRRVAGLGLVLITLIGVLVVHAIGRARTGTALRPSAPTAPEAGSCLALRAGAWAATPCAEPHSGEVAASWPSVTHRSAHSYQACVNAGRSYLEDPLAADPGWPTPQAGVSTADNGRADWGPPSVLSTTTLVYGPGPSMVPGWSWQACVIRPMLLNPYDAGYRGRLRDVPVTGNLPQELRPCFVLPDAVGPVGIACTAGHIGEVFAARPLRVFGTVLADDTTAQDPAVRADCLRIAQRVTGAADPTYGGRLHVVVNLHPTGMGYVVSAKPQPKLSDSYTLYQANCSLQTRSGRQLYSSLVGLGSAPLPLR